MNWGGGWSDTPPYCNEKGGTVLNAAILLNGEKPVEVTLERIPEQKVVFDSRDMDVHGEFDTIEPLQATGDPYDPFALQKACLLACGIISREGHTLGEILERLGSGFVMHSEVTNVPKGSGLGTSSILSAACVKAVFEFMGIAYTEEDLYAHVLAMEQIMSTGGGGQDQVGGITSGLKYITSMPGLQQRLQVAHIELSPQTKKELDERFVLIYTGQRRLARNLLRDVVGRYVGIGEFLVDDTVHLTKFFHQVLFIVQSAGGIYKKHIHASCLRRIHGIKHHAGGIRTFFSADHGNIRPGCPLCQLVSRCGTESIRCGNKDFPALIL